MTTYIAGPMTGLPDFNYPAFHAMAAQLRSVGVDVRNPAENAGGDTSQPWDYYMRLGLAQLLECDSLVLLPGWRESRGASLEWFVATSLNMAITYPISEGP